MRVALFPLISVSLTIMELARTTSLSSPKKESKTGKLRIEEVVAIKSVFPAAWIALRICGGSPTITPMTLMPLELSPFSRESANSSPVFPFPAAMKTCISLGKFTESCSVNLKISSVSPLPAFVPSGLFSSMVRMLKRIQRSRSTAAMPYSPETKSNGFLNSFPSAGIFLTRSGLGRNPKF